MDSFTSFEALLSTSTSSDNAPLALNDVEHHPSVPVNSEAGGGDAIAFCVIS
ncbi:pheromone precursor [Lentinula aff. lateritia]|uniref:Pheromone n=1 Tax=Lentinula aff. lateritia TaxID=2804960 RepID=A0ACC1U443_9AGAR|nr:pheromone precursor [Lentinula aff. lateritia]